VPVLQLVVVRHPADHRQVPVGRQHRHAAHACNQTTLRDKGG
jgi:hypothetical protein